MASRYTALSYTSLNNTQFYLVRTFRSTSFWDKQNSSISKIRASKGSHHKNSCISKLNLRHTIHLLIIKCWPSAARFFKSWTLTLWCTILSYMSFFIPPKMCISRPYCREFFDRLLLLQTISKINLAIFRMIFIRIDHCDCCRLGNPETS